MTLSLSERFAAHVTAARFEDLPADAVAQAKVFILDTFGVGIAGATAAGAAELKAAARQWGNGAEAVAWGRAGRWPAGIAVLLNGFAVHCQEFDCLCEPAVLHPMAAVFSAAMAYAERRGGVSGRDLIVATAVGVDVACYLGIASNQALRFFRPATAGGFGAAAACGRLGGLDVGQITNAFGLQLAQMSGTMQAHVEASPALPLQVGMNAQAGLQSADMAAAGLLPSPTQPAPAAGPTPAPVFVRMMAPDSAFVRQVATQLEADVMQMGGTVARSPEGATVVNVDVNFVAWGPRDKPPGLVGTTAAILSTPAIVLGATGTMATWTAANAAAAGVAGVGPLTDALIALTPTMNAEAIWEATVITSDRVVMRLQEPVYIRDHDIPLYVKHASLSPIASWSSSSPLRARTVRYDP